MKKILTTLAASLSIAVAVSAQTTIFQQDFNSSTTLADYVHATAPNSGQWNAISTSGSGVTISVAGNNLTFTRAAANAGAFSRTTDFSPIPSAILYAFDLSVSGNTTALTSAAVWQVGSGFGTPNSAESNANTYARFGLNFTTTDGTFSIRDITNSTSSANFSGVQTITWVLNNTGAQISYSNPTAGVSFLADDRADLWIGNSLVFTGVAIQTNTQSITDLKFAFTAGTGSITMDNFTVTAIPEPSTYAAIMGLLTLGIVAYRRRKKA